MPSTSTGAPVGRQRTGERDSFGAYLANLARTELLRPEEERELSEAVRLGRDAGEELAAMGEAMADHGAPGSCPERRKHLLELVARGAAARERMVEANLRLVVALARRHRVPGLSLADLVQEGNLGLLQAVERYDGRRGFRFSTYASWWIRQALSHGVAEGAWPVRLPDEAATALRALRRATEEVGRLAEGRAAQAQELASRTGLSAGRVSELLCVPTEMLSLAEPSGGRDGAPLEDLLADRASMSTEDEALERVGRLGTGSLLAVLDERERTVVTYRVGLLDGRQRSFEDVASEVGVTKERARQLYDAALAKLRHPAARSLRRRHDPDCD